MLNSNLRAWGAAALMLAAAHQALAAGEGHIRLVREKFELRFNADSTTEKQYDLTWRALDQQGVSSIGQQYLYYQTDRQLIELLDAETIPANGDPIAVPSQDIKVQDGVLGGISYPNTKVLQISFSKLAPGDSIHFRYRMIEKSLDLPTGNSTLYFLPRDVLRDNTELTLRYPASLKVNIATNGLHSESDTSAGAVRELRWTYRSTETLSEEPGSVNHWRNTPYLMVSTFADWQAIAAGYQQEVRRKTIITDSVRALAQQIVGEAKADSDQVKRIYDWVRTHIRYLASYVGDGGFVPNDVDVILRRRYGDCKDHALLMETLLAARGIDASQVLIDANTDNYLLPDLPVWWFNHAITYVPALDLFLDSTNDFASFGSLPEGDADKPVLITKNFNGVRRTPATTSDSARMEQHVRIKVALDGSASRVTEVIGFGSSTVQVRSFLNSIGVGKERDWANRWIADRGLAGDGDLERIFSPGDTEPIGYRLTERVANFVDQPEAALIPFKPGVGGPIEIIAILNRFNPENRYHDFRCGAFSADAVVEIELQPEMKVVFLPKDEHIRTGVISFDAHYERHANIYRQIRKFRSDSSKAWCSADDYTAVRRTMNRIQRSMAASLVYLLR
jgi:transglutaminase-like putative cysteine protease